MSGTETGSQAPQPPSSSAAPRATRRLSFWIKELPFALVLILTTLGVAYTSLTRQPLVGFWELLAPLLALVCIGSGWPSANDKTARLILIGSQVLHWLAFIVVMNVLLLPSVQRNFTANSTAIAVFTLLALGTFTAGLQVFSWQVCSLGLVMALAVPAVAWIENSALIVAVIFVLMLAVGVAVWWHWRKTAPAGQG
jgi:hypothetical protein